MTTTKTKAKPPAAPAAQSEVLTLSEAAAYLRVSQEEILRLAGRGDFPGRRVGSEWRFLKSALQDWLRTPPAKPSKEALLAAIGSWKDDPDLDAMLKQIYQQRGRPMTEGGE